MADANPTRSNADQSMSRRSLIAASAVVLAAPTHALSQETAPMATDPASPETAAPLTTLDPSAGHLTIINTYVVAPDRAEELVGLLVRATAETVGRAPGFVSANFHVSLDRTRVVNYAQWQSQEALAAAAADPAIMARIREAGQIADSFAPVPYQLRQSVRAGQA